MKTALLTTLVMIAFALNSVLNRAALDDGVTGPAAFAALRLLSGALVLSLLVAVQRRHGGLRRQSALAAPAALAVYVLGFSFAYVWLDAGVGALILFGGVQITMFGATVLAGAPAPTARWIGAGMALTGLAVMLWPAGATAPSLFGALLMAAAAVGWGVYSLIGRGAMDPLAETARAFVLAAPLSLVVWLVRPDGISGTGAMLAVLSGAVTSGLGYALWYAVLPRIETSTAALAQLTVPIIAALAGMMLLGEAPGWRFAAAAALVLGGVALGILAPQRRIGSSGS